LLAYWRSLIQELPIPAGGRDAIADLGNRLTSGWQRLEASVSQALHTFDAHRAHARDALGGISQRFARSEKRGDAKIVATPDQQARMAAGSQSAIPEQPARRARGRGLLPQSGAVERGAARTATAKKRLGAKHDGVVPHRPKGASGPAIAIVTE
jgi:hypothetical protein